MEITIKDIRPEFKIIEDVKDEPTLKSAQEFVGGYVEGISFPNGDYLIVNEEGKLIGLPIMKRHHSYGRIRLTMMTT